MSTPLNPAGSFEFPRTPAEFLAEWTTSRGNLRRFLEDTVLPPLNEEQQQAAGTAAAEAAVRDIFALDLEDFHLGLDSLRGSVEAAGALRISPIDPDVPQDPGAAAFFDVDNTLIEGSSLISFALGLARRRYFTLREMLPIAWKQLKFRVTGAENAEDVAEGRAQALEFITGRRVDDLVALCEEIVDRKMQYKTFPGTRALADLHLAAGQQVWLVTATPVQLAQVLARRFGFTGALGTVAEVKDGRFTGRLVGDILHGPGKKYAVAALAALEQLDLSRCTAYSDSINDLPMLSMVGTAVAVNPDRPLRREAIARGWEVRDYRNLRRAVRTWGPAGLLTGAMSYAGWYLRRRLRT